MNMKHFVIFHFVFVFTTLVSFAQDCPVITYTYDAAGNRIQTKLVIQPCNNPPPPNGLAKRKEDKKEPAKDTMSFATMKVSVFPSPAQDMVNVVLEQTGNTEPLGEGTVLLYDSNGRILYSGITTSNQLQIDVQNFVVGIYYLNVKRGSKQASYSIFKN